MCLNSEDAVDADAPIASSAHDSPDDTTSDETADFSGYSSNYDYEESIPSDTTSLSTSQYLFEKRNGRTYHHFRSDRGYVLPNDEPEKDRLDMQYWAIHEALGKRLIFAPIGEHPQNIVDVGTGTGIWAIDVADLYPSAAVLGTDLSPIQPTWVPPNVSFELHDCLQYPWELNRKFDLIHTQLINAFAVRDWKQFYEEAYQSLKPGGWVENKEFDLIIQSDDNSIPEPSAIKNWLLQWDQGAGGGFRRTGADYAEAMRTAGFVDIVVKEFKLPIGVWDKENLNSGILSLTAMTDHIEGLSNRIFMERLGMTEEQMKAATEPVVREFRLKAMHAYWPM
jgi:SAM-dependent methyltransferase